MTTCCVDVLDLFSLPPPLRSTCLPLIVRRYVRLHPSRPRARELNGLLESLPWTQDVVRFCTDVDYELLRREVRVGQTPHEVDAGVDVDVDDVLDLSILDRDTDELSTLFDGVEAPPATDGDGLLPALDPPPAVGPEPVLPASIGLSLSDDDDPLTVVRVITRSLLLVGSHLDRTRDPNGDIAPFTPIVLPRSHDDPLLSSALSILCPLRTSALQKLFWVLNFVFDEGLLCPDGANPLSLRSYLVLLSCLWQTHTMSGVLVLRGSDSPSPSASGGSGGGDASGPDEGSDVAGSGPSVEECSRNVLVSFVLNHPHLVGDILGQLIQEAERKRMRDEAAVLRVDGDEEEESGTGLEIASWSDDVIRKALLRPLLKCCCAGQGQGPEGSRSLDRLLLQEIRFACVRGTCCGDIILESCARLGDSVRFLSTCLVGVSASYVSAILRPSFVRALKISKGYTRKKDKKTLVERRNATHRPAPRRRQVSRPLLAEIILCAFCPPPTSLGRTRIVDEIVTGLWQVSSASANSGRSVSSIRILCVLAWCNVQCWPRGKSLAETISSIPTGFWDLPSSRVQDLLITLLAILSCRRSWQSLDAREALKTIVRSMWSLPESGEGFPVRVCLAAVQLAVCAARGDLLKDYLDVALHFGGGGSRRKFHGVEGEELSLIFSGSGAPPMPAGISKASLPLGHMGRWIVRVVQNDQSLSSPSSSGLLLDLVHFLLSANVFRQNGVDPRPCIRVLFTWLLTIPKMASLPPLVSSILDAFVSDCMSRKSSPTSVYGPFSPSEIMSILDECLPIAGKVVNDRQLASVALVAYYVLLVDGFALCQTQFFYGCRVMERCRIPELFEWLESKTAKEMLGALSYTLSGMLFEQCQHCFHLELMLLAPTSSPTRMDVISETSSADGTAEVLLTPLRDPPSTTLVLKALANEPVDASLQSPLVRCLAALLAPAERIPLHVGHAFFDAWRTYCRQSPMTFCVATVNAIHSDHFDHATLTENVLYLFGVDRRLFDRPRLFPIFLEILLHFLTRSEYRLLGTSSPESRGSEGIREVGSGGGEEGVSDHEARFNLLITEQSAVVQLLLELCLPRSGQDCPKPPPTEIIHAVCSFIHRLFLRRPILAKVIHFQTYSPVLLPITTSCIRSIHICRDFLIELMTHGSVAKSVFGILLASYILLHANTQEHLPIAQRAVDETRLLLGTRGRGGMARERRFVQPLLDALKRFVRAYRFLLASQVTDVLMEIRLRFKTDLGIARLTEEAYAEMLKTVLS